MKKLFSILILSAILLSSCSQKVGMDNGYMSDVIDFETIDRISLNSIDGEIVLSDSLQFILDFKEVKQIKGLYKFRKRPLYIKHIDGSADTLGTDGVLFFFKNKYYKTKDEKRILEVRFQ